MKYMCLLCLIAFSCNQYKEKANSVETDHPEFKPSQYIIEKQHDLPLIITYSYQRDSFWLKSLEYQLNHQLQKSKSCADSAAKYKQLIDSLRNEIKR